MTLWAIEVYRLVDPGLNGFLPPSALSQFEPKEYDALFLVQSEVLTWSKGKST